MSSSDSISSGQLTLSPEEELWDAALNDSASTIEKSTADLNCKTPLGNTALHIAASGGCFNAVKALLARGAVIDCQDNDGLTPLFKAVQENDVVIADFLLSNGATTAGKDDTNMSLLHWAARNGMTVLVERLLTEEGVAKIHDVDIKEEGGKTPLHFASFNGHLSTVRLLLKLEAKVSWKDNIKWTPLHEAAFWGHLSVVRCLLEAGAEINTTTEDKETPLNFSNYNGHSAISELLRANGGIQ